MQESFDQWIMKLCAYLCIGLALILFILIWVKAVVALLAWIAST